MTVNRAQIFHQRNKINNNFSENAKMENALLARVGLGTRPTSSDGNLCMYWALLDQEMGTAELSKAQPRYLGTKEVAMGRAMDLRRMALAGLAESAEELMGQYYDEYEGGIMDERQNVRGYVMDELGATGSNSKEEFARQLRALERATGWDGAQPFMLVGMATGYDKVIEVYSIPANIMGDGSKRQLKVQVINPRSGGKGEPWRLFYRRGGNRKDDMGHYESVRKLEEADKLQTIQSYEVKVDWGKRVFERLEGELGTPGVINTRSRAVVLEEVDGKADAGSSANAGEQGAAEGSPEAGSLEREEESEERSEERGEGCRVDEWREEGQQSKFPSKLTPPSPPIREGRPTKKGVEFNRHVQQDQQQFNQEEGEDEGEVSEASAERSDGVSQSSYSAQSTQVSTDSEQESSSAPGMGMGDLEPTANNIRNWRQAMVPDEDEVGHQCAMEGCVKTLSSIAGLVAHVKAHVGPISTASKDNIRMVIAFCREHEFAVCVGGEKGRCTMPQAQISQRRGVGRGGVFKCRGCEGKEEESEEGVEGGSGDDNEWEGEFPYSRSEPHYNLLSKDFEIPEGWSNENINIGGKIITSIEILNLSGPSTTNQIPSAWVARWAMALAQLMKVAARGLPGAMLALVFFSGGMAQTLSDPDRAPWLVRQKLAAWTNQNYEKFWQLGQRQDRKGGGERSLTERVVRAMKSKGVSAGSTALMSEGVVGKTPETEAAQKAMFSLGEVITETDFGEEQDDQEVGMFQVDLKTLLAEINQLKPGAAPGLDGISAAILQQLIRHEHGADFQQALLGFVNMVLAGKLDKHSVRLLGAGRLNPLHKHSLATRQAAEEEARGKGELPRVPDARPIVILSQVRRLVMALVAHDGAFKIALKERIGIAQLGTGTSAGSEVAIHVIRSEMSTWDANAGDRMVVAMDATKAFNNVNRKVVLGELKRIFPGAFALLLSFYGDSTPVIWEDAVFESGSGVFQGDPMASPLFCLGLAGLMTNCAKQFPNVNLLGFLDDLFASGKSKDTFAVMKMIQDQGPEVGFFINPNKGQRARNLAHHLEGDELEEHVRSLREQGGEGGPVGTPIVNGVPEYKGTIVVLGGIIGPTELVRPLLQQVINESMAGLGRLEGLHDHQAALILLRETQGFPRINHLLRVTPSEQFVKEDGSSMLDVFDESKNKILSTLVIGELTGLEKEGVFLPVHALARAQLPMGRRGGLGMPNAGILASACYAGSMHDTYEVQMALSERVCGRNEARLLHQSLVTPSWDIYDTLVLNTPVEPEDDKDDDGRKLPEIFRDNQQRDQANDNSEASTSTKQTQRRLTKRLVRTVAKMGLLKTQKANGMGPHLARVAALDSRYIKGIPGRDGGVKFTNRELSAVLQFTLGIESEFAMGGVVENRCRTLGQVANHSLPSCKTGSGVMDRHNGTASSLAANLTSLGIHGRATAKPKDFRLIDNNGRVLEPADCLVTSYHGEVEAKVAFDITFVDMESTKERVKGQSIPAALEERRREKISKYSQVCEQSGVKLAPLVFTTGGRPSSTTAAALCDAFDIGAREEGQDDDESKDQQLFNHIFHGRGLCPRGLGSQQYTRIKAIKRFLMTMTSLAARTTARSILAHTKRIRRVMGVKEQRDWDKDFSYDESQDQAQDQDQGNNQNNPKETQEARPRQC
jgi:hypothetical protein